MDDNAICLTLAINAPVAVVWQCLSLTNHIMHWNFAHESWHCPNAYHDLQVGGQLNYRMQAKDGSFGFDYRGNFDEIKPNQCLSYHLDDGRRVRIELEALNDKTTLFREIFEPETTHDIDTQRLGWLAIAQNLKSYSEQFYLN